MSLSLPAATCVHASLVALGTSRVREVQVLRIVCYSFLKRTNVVFIFRTGFAKSNNLWLMMSCLRWWITPYIPRGAALPAFSVHSDNTGPSAHFTPGRPHPTPTLKKQKI